MKVWYTFVINNVFPKLVAVQWQASFGQLWVFLSWAAFGLFRGDKGHTIPQATLRKLEEKLCASGSFCVKWCWTFPTFQIGIETGMTSLDRAVESTKVHQILSKVPNLNFPAIWIPDEQAQFPSQNCMSWLHLAHKSRLFVALRYNTAAKAAAFSNKGRRCSAHEGQTSLRRL